MNKKVCSFPILFALLALLIGICAVVFPASAQAAPSTTGSITVGGTVARSYNAYQIFSANVIDDDNDAKIATDLVWASDAVRDAVLPVLHSAGMPNSQTTAQEAAERLNTDSHLTSALSAQLARSSGALAPCPWPSTRARRPSCPVATGSSSPTTTPSPRTRPAPRRSWFWSAAAPSPSSPRPPLPRWPSMCWRTAPPPGARPPTPRSATTCTGASRPRFPRVLPPTTPTRCSSSTP